MTLNLMDTVKGMLTSEAVGTAAAKAGESPDGMRRAVNSAIPSIFAGLTQGASAPEGAARIFGLLTETGGSKPGLQGLMSAAFGSRGSAVPSVISKASGVKSEGALRALSLALPMVFGALSKHVLSNRMTAGGMAQMLFGQKKAILDDPNTPPGLAGALGLGSLEGLGGSSAEVSEPYVSSARSPTAPATPATMSAQGRSVAAGAPKRSRGALILPAALLGALLIWGIVRSHVPRPGVAEQQAPGPTFSPREAPRIQPAPAPAAGPIVLPGGKSLDVGPNSGEAQIARGLSDTSTSLPRTYGLEHLTFDRGSAAIGPRSATTIQNLAMMMQAYPSARIRIQGNTDSTGTPRTNLTLSESRAHAVKQALVAHGIAADRIETSGEALRPVPGLARPAEIVLLNR